MRIILIFILLSTVPVIAQKDKLFQNEFGLGIELNQLHAETINENLKYFSSDYIGGIGYSVLLQNRTLLNNWSLITSVGYNFQSQKQSVIFSNAKDAIIDFKPKHQLHSWQINFGAGKKITLKDHFKLNISTGAAINGYFNNKTPLKEITSNVESTYIDNDDHWQGGSSIESHLFTVSYFGIRKLSPWLKVGIEQKLNNKVLEFGLAYSYRRMEYENFFIVKSATYSAIANSKSISSTIGIYVDFFF